MTNVTKSTYDINTTFDAIVSDEKVLKAIRELGFTNPTEIQALTIPAALAGKDLIGQAKTGSGKTLAFGVPILCNIDPVRKPQALILAPTRELCQQIALELSKIAKHSNVRIVAVYGGASIGPQISALREAQIVVATPGRLCDHLERHTFDTRAVKFLVFDEADRMFDMGFMNDMEHITKQLPTKRQTILFSATMPEAIKKLTARYQNEPVHIKTISHVEEHLLPQFFVRTDNAGKFSLLVHLIQKEDPNLAIVFCPTKHGAKSLAKNLSMQGIEADAMHGNLTQGQRERVIADFKKGNIRVLVATDVAARGLDVKHVTHVFNYDVSKSAEDYVHRIGRTARAGAVGKAITFVEAADQYSWRAILRLPNVKVTEMKVDDVKRIEFKRQPRDDDSNSRSGPSSNRQSRDRDRVSRIGDRSRPFGRSSEGRSSEGRDGGSRFGSSRDGMREGGSRFPRREEGSSERFSAPRRFGSSDRSDRPARSDGPARSDRPAARFESSDRERPVRSDRSAEAKPGHFNTWHEHAPRSDRPAREERAPSRFGDRSEGPSRFGSRSAEPRREGFNREGANREGSSSSRFGDRKPFGASSQSSGFARPGGFPTRDDVKSSGVKKPFGGQERSERSERSGRDDEGRGFKPRGAYSDRPSVGPRRPNAARRPINRKAR